ncbi:uncharacterized protein [Maniola hyperantus]|uniref:uncharacterized protein n=1 Tax=Aphantopus hyperantus TaxID=2795564 RepID=UPI001569EF68|nr:uncharacterized protein LOC117997109 isoform X2 [Maniola hyperantus]
MCICRILMFFIYEAFPHLVFTESCGDIICSNVYDPVCGEATALDGRKVTQRFQNICYLRLLQCQFIFTGLEQIPDEYCNIRKGEVSVISGRRVYDFSIVGAHQACNHTCPTYCLDTYDPACAQIWSSNMQTYHYRPMINHCHIDMFSCVVGVNVTIQPLIGKCYKNPSAINFMFNIASLKTLKLLDEPPPHPIAQGRSRRAYSYNVDVNQLLKKELKRFVKTLTTNIKALT